MQSLKSSKIFALPGNGGIAADAVCVPVKATDVDAMVSYAAENGIDFCVVAPDDPLVLGMVDAMEAKGIRCFGPSKAAAALEGSKVFAKELMKKYGIPTAAYETFGDPQKAIEYVKAQNSYPTVIKADGLALGKGVIIAEDFAAAEAGIRSIMEDKIFGKSGSQIVIEEFLTGPEVSVLSFTDSHVVVPMISSMDHKRALDGDKGLNTGGMGTVAPNPFYTEKVARQCMKEIFLPTMHAMNAEGRPFKGVIYFGLMITPKGPKVIEYNCRFGDPETQVVLPLLESDLLDIMLKIYDQKLDEADVRFADKSACCVVMASEGYPKKYETGFEISMPEDKNIYVAGAKLAEGRLVTGGGRVLGVTETADTLEEAVDKAYDTVKQVSFQNAYYRKDIGKRALEAERN